MHPKEEHGVTQTAHTCQHGVERPRCCPLQKDSAAGIARIYRVKRTPTLPKQSLQIPKYTLQTDSDSDLYNILTVDTLDMSRQHILANLEMWPGIASPVQKPKPESSNLAVVCLPSIAIPLQDHLKQFSDRLMLHMFHAVRMTSILCDVTVLWPCFQGKKVDAPVMQTSICMIVDTLGRK